MDDRVLERDMLIESLQAKICGLESKLIAKDDSLKEV